MPRVRGVFSEPVLGTDREEVIGAKATPGGPGLAFPERQHGPFFFFKASYIVVWDFFFFLYHDKRFRELQEFRLTGNANRDGNLKTKERNPTLHRLNPRRCHRLLN